LPARIRIASRRDVSGRSVSDNPARTTLQEKSRAEILSRSRLYEQQEHDSELRL